MKKLLVIGFTLIWIAAVSGAFGVSASAYAAVGVDIWVEIVNGGTAAVTTEVNCPFPRQSSLTLEDGENGAFHIDFDEAGVYSYLIRIVPDEREIIYDSSVYNARIYVNEQDGQLFAAVVIYDTATGLKYTKPNGRQYIEIGFENILEPPTEFVTESPSETIPTVEPPDRSGSGTDPSTPTTEPTAHAEGGTDPSTPNRPENGTYGQNGGYSRPQTGDDTRMVQYFLLAILASAGLFILAVIYWRETNRLIRSKR